MLPSSHLVPIERAAAGAAPSPQILADAFSEFISASSLLEDSYRGLQHEVARLNAELGRRNAALTRSLAENDRIRAALQQMLDSMPCGVLVVDDAERILMMNPECRNLLRIGDLAVRSLCDLPLSHQFDFEARSEACDEQAERDFCLESDQAARWLAIRVRTLSAASAATKAADGPRRIWILRDVTAEKLAEQEREKARRTAVLAEISTILAHEIRNPLASMELFATLMEEDPGSALQWISNLRAGIRSLSGTVNNVLNLNDPNALALVPVNLVPCVQSGVEFVRPIADQDGIALSFAAETDAVTIAGNEQALQQIVLNIVCNAMRHTGLGGEVSVMVFQAETECGNVALVEITDTGCGMSADVLEHIFEPGFSGSGDSPGLGLAVCKRFMERMGGEIRVSSRVDHGTKFELEFPAL